MLSLRLLLLLVGAYAPPGIALAQSTGRHAGLQVLGDSGRTVPIAGYLAPVAAPLLSEEQAPAAVSMAFDPFPVVTRGMSPGKAAPRAALALAVPLAQPLALMGTDPYSIDWLKRRAAWLARKDAVIQLVEAPNLAAYEEIRRLAGGLAVIPASGDMLASQHGLARYPIVILPNGGLAQ